MKAICGGKIQRVPNNGTTIVCCEHCGHGGEEGATCDYSALRPTHCPDCSDPLSDTESVFGVCLLCQIQGALNSSVLVQSSAQAE